MKRLTTVVTALVVVSLLACPFAQAQNFGWRGGRDAAAGVVGPQGPRGNPDRGDDFGRRPMPGKRIAHLIGRVIMMAVAAPWAKDDAEMQRLVDQAIADRKTMIGSESARVGAFENLVRGIRAGKTKEELKPEADALEAATKKLRQDARKLHEHLRAIGKRLRELRPERPEGDEGQEGAWRGRRGNRQGGEGQEGAWRGRRGNRNRPNRRGGDRDDDFPPVID